MSIAVAILTPLLVLSLLIILCISGKACIKEEEEEHPELASIRRTISELRATRQRPPSSRDIEEAFPRNEEFITKFKFQTVTAAANDDDESVINAQSKWTIRGMLSTWRTPSKKESCCICLEVYNVGDAICAAQTPSCDHAFHQECIFEWLQNDHNDCPLCRTDLLNA